MGLINSEYVGEMMLRVIREEQQEGLFKEFYNKYIFHSPGWNRIMQKEKGKKSIPPFKEEIILLRLIILLGSNSIRF